MNSQVINNAIMSTATTTNYDGYSLTSIDVYEAVEAVQKVQAELAEKYKDQIDNINTQLSIVDTKMSDMKESVDWASTIIRSKNSNVKDTRTVLAVELGIIKYLTPNMTLSVAKVKKQSTEEITRIMTAYNTQYVPGVNAAMTAPVDNTADLERASKIANEYNSLVSTHNNLIAQKNRYLGR